MQYGEFAVADYLSKKIKGTSVFIPASAQEKVLTYCYIAMTMGATRPTLFKLKCPGHIIMTRKILAIHSTCGSIGSCSAKRKLVYTGRDIYKAF